MKDFNTFVTNYLEEEELLDEATSVTFGGESYPTSGWCIILAGGSGSGKGYVQKDALLIDAKVFDVDKLKDMYLKAVKHKLINDPNEYNLKNPEDVTRLHHIIKRKNYDASIRYSFFKNIEKQKEKPNIIFDITGKSKKDFIHISEFVKQYGYKISLVWVVTNRELASVQNKSRDRVVRDDIFNHIHNEVKKNVNEFILTDAGKYIDECWIFFNSTKKPREEMTDYEKKELKDNRAFKLKKKEGKFILPIDLQIRLNDVMGPYKKTAD